MSQQEGWLAMKKIGIGIDYSNICKDYNTVYLDRDNTDKETSVCMTKVVDWLKAFLSEILETFEYKVYRMNQNSALNLDEVAHKRFLFYSLEKAIIAQTFILQREPAFYDSLAQWSDDSQDGLLIQNDDEGEGIFFYFNEDSKIHHWLMDKLKDFSLDEVSFEER